MTMETGFAYTAINGFPTDGQVVDAWKKLFEGIGYANNFLTDTENIDFEAPKFQCLKHKHKRRCVYIALTVIGM